VEARRNVPRRQYRKPINSGCKGLLRNIIRQEINAKAQAKILLLLGNIYMDNWSQSRSNEDYQNAQNYLERASTHRRYPEIQNAAQTSLANMRSGGF
jgi:hypothetical protein